MYRKHIHAVYIKIKKIKILIFFKAHVYVCILGVRRRTAARPSSGRAFMLYGHVFIYIVCLYLCSTPLRRNPEENTYYCKIIQRLFVFGRLFTAAFYACARAARAHNLRYRVPGPRHRLSNTTLSINVLYGALGSIYRST